MANPLALLSTVVGGLGIAKEIGRGGDKGSLYEIGARTKLTSSKSPSRVQRGAACVTLCRDLGLQYKEIGKILTIVGYSKEEINSVLQYLS